MAKQQGNDPVSNTAQKVHDNKPLVDTVVLDNLAQANLPFRGQFRKNILDRTRKAVKQRRTVSGLSSRLASTLSTPISNAIQEELSNRIQSRLQNTAQNAANQVTGGSKK